jgi:uncharacterized protein YjiS (DUF1127 family)
LSNANPTVGYLRRSAAPPISPSRHRSSRATAAVAARVVAVLALLRRWHRRARERALLAALDERMLRDIGVERSDVEREINQRFWRE